MKERPISDYALLGDCRTAALVSREGSIDWLCWPRFESRSIFAHLLDTGHGGYWRVAPRAPGKVEREYLDTTNVLHTTWRCEQGILSVYDFMPVGRFDGLLPEHAVIRLLRCEAGTVNVQAAVLARGAYGQAPIVWKKRRHHHRAHFESFQFTLQAFGCAYEINGDGVFADFTLRAGERAGMALTANRDGPAVLLTDLQLWRLLDATVTEWRNWASACTYQGPYQSEVIRSALALKTMNFAPSGAVVAAPTASLPESPGNTLNWDYRYCWLRDASHTTRALGELGFEHEAETFVSWLLHATKLSRPGLRVLYDVFGRRPHPEFEATWLRGYLKSRPVRIGNAAEGQHQLDVYGEVIDATYQRIVRAGQVDGETASLLLDMATYACQHWREADAGIWEYRDELRHHTHSKLLCWVAADRVARLQDAGLVPRNSTDFHTVRRAIARHLRDQAAYAEGVLTAAADDPEVDASVLLAAAFGFYAPRDRVMVATFNSVQEKLKAGAGLLYRAERFVGREGAFLFCSFWAIEYLAMGGGTLEEAERWFAGVLAYLNDVGLYSEEVGVPNGEALGNFPQAFSHVGLINAALALEKRRAAEAERKPQLAGRERRA